MTLALVTLALTVEQEEHLRLAAQIQGVDADGLLHRLVNQVLAQLVPAYSDGPGLRTPGLHAGRYRIAEDFDAPLPDSFWFGNE